MQEGKKMIQLTPFSQAALLQAASVEGPASYGVCVAMCDRWIALLRKDRKETPELRLRKLQAALPQIVEYQNEYGDLRAVLGREAARTQMAAGVGIDYEQQTTVLKIFIGMEGIRRRLAEDLKSIGAAATWSMRFQDGGGHAIAGFCNLAGQEPMLRMQMHVFDPNIGEYVGDFGDLDGILADLFNRFPLYNTTIEVHRTHEV
jgi:hypothetical protein